MAGLPLEPALSIDDTTYLVTVFIFTPNSPVPFMLGQAAENPS